jgi:rSAM/selenodomain-associated transferase 2
MGDGRLRIKKARRGVLVETTPNVPIETPPQEPRSARRPLGAQVPVTVSVVIPALNEAANIERAVASALAAGALEVIVCDGGSQDTTVQLATQAGATVVHSRPGRGIQQNIGAEQASGDFLLFLHADNWLSVDAIDQVAQFASDGGLAGGMRQSIDAAGWRYRLLEIGNAARIRLLHTAYGDQAIFVRSSTFHEVGGFPAAPIMEDVLLMRKLKGITRPTLLEGPVGVSARRWQTHGILRQTLLNLGLVSALKCGASPGWLAKFYPRHGAAE